MTPHSPYPDEDPASAGQPEGTPETAGADAAGGPTPPDGAVPPSAPPPYTPPPNPAPPYTQPYTQPYPPPGAGDPRPAVAPPQNFFDWIRSHGIQRGRERWVGGVASGIAHRLNVDPLIVRGILIVLTVFAGVGVLLYGLAWAFLPEPDGRIHVQEAAAGRWSTGMTGALITTVIGFPSLGSGVWGWDRYGFGAFVWTVFWVGGAIYVVYYLSQRNKARRPGTSGAPGGPFYGHPDAGGTGAPASSVPASSVPASSGPASAGAAYPGPAYPGAAAGWSAPPSGPLPPSGPDYRPVPPPPAPRPRATGPGAPAVAVTAGLALLVGGGIKALDAVHAINLGGTGNAVVWAAGAAVLGLGILVCGLRGRSAGILSFFAVVALVTGAVYGVAPNVDRARFQNADWAPTSIGQAADGFDITGGTGTVDLTRLNLQAPLGSDVVVRLDATASNITVAIPRNVPVQVQADLTMGNLNDGRGNHGGMTSQQNDYNTDVPGGRLIIKVSGTLSNITVKEGN